MLAWSLVLFALVTCATVDGFRTVCYYTNWAQYRSGKGLFYPEDINPNLCTHLIYAFAKPVGLNIQPFEWNDDSTQWSEGMYDRVMKLKSKNPNLKILLAVGGWNMASQPFVPVVESAASRATFAQNAVTFLRQRNFEGLDMDWEYPGSRGGTPADRDKLVLLMQELRTAFEQEARTSGKPRLLLTGAFPAGKDNIDTGFDVLDLLQVMDFASIMTYDLHGSWEPYTGINAPLFANPTDTGDSVYLNLDWVARYYISMNAPKDKLNIGIALYGRTFTLNDPNRHDIGSPASQPGEAGQFTGEKGFVAYYEVCDLIHSGALVVDVPSQRNRYLVKGNQWVGYDDVQSVTEKACYIKQHGFGGVMFWAPDLDDFSGQTCKQGTYPLITAVITELQNPSFTNCPTPSNISQVITPGPGITGTHQPVSATPAILETHDFNCYNKEDDFYPDPESCSHYYICANEDAFKAHCGTGKFFDPDKKTCEQSYLVACTNTQTTQAVTAVPPPIGVCTGVASGGTVAHPTDCHKFYMCEDSGAAELDCLGSMVFNPSIGKCDFSRCSHVAVIG